MFKLTFYINFAIVFTISFLVSPNAKAERVYGQIEPPRFKLGRLAIKYEMDRFSSRENFSSNGDAAANLTGDFEAFNSYLGVENDFSRSLALSAGLQLGLSRSVSNSVSRRNIGIKGVQIGASRLLPFSKKKLSFVLDGKFFQSLHSNRFDSDRVALGDGTSWAQLGLWVGTDDIQNIRWWFFGGINYPFSSLAKNFVFLIRPEFKVSKGRIGIGLEGQFPIIDDGDLGEPTDRLRFIDERNGGSLYYQPLNASYVGTSFWFGFEPAPLTEVKVGLSERIFGRSAARGLTIFASVELSFSVSRTGYEFPYVKIDRRKSQVQKNQGIRRLKDYAKPDKAAVIKKVKKTKKSSKKAPRRRRRRL